MPTSEAKGAATAAPTPSTPEDANRLLEAATTPEQALAIYELAADREEGWRAVKLRAEWIYGKLLPAKQPGKATSNSPLEVGGDAMRVSRARQVAAVPKEVLDDYIASEPKPSREGLLRKTRTASPRTRKVKRGQPDEILGRLTRRLDAVRTRDGFAEERPPRWSHQDVADVDALLRQQEKPSKRPASYGGKRKRQVYDQIRESGDTRLRRLMVDISEATRRLEHMELPDDVSLGEETQDDITMLYEDLMILVEWAERQVGVTIAHMGDMTTRRKIRTLRERAQDPSSTPHERITATRLADRLEQRHRQIES